MKFAGLVDELENSHAYKKFKRDYDNSFLSAGFFILDLKKSTEQIQIDYYLPDEKKIVGFEFPFTEAKLFDDKIKPMVELSTNLLVDIDDLESKCLEIISNHDSSLKPTKIIAILKNNEWNLTAMDDMLGIIRIRLDALTGKELSFDKGSLMDFMGFKRS